MGYVEQPAAPYVQDATGVVVNGMAGVMPVVGGMPAPVAAAPVAVMNGITRVYVGNLSWETEWQDLKDHMRSAGEVRMPQKYCLVLLASREEGDMRKDVRTTLLCAVTYDYFV